MLIYHFSDALTGLGQLLFVLKLLTTVLPLLEYYVLYLQFMQGPHTLTITVKTFCNMNSFAYYDKPTENYHLSL